LDFVFDMAFRNSRRLAEFRAGEYSFLLPADTSDYLLSCLKAREIPAKAMPVLVHEYIHAFLSTAPLGNLYARIDQAYSFTRNQHIYSHQGSDYSHTFRQSFIGDRLLRYISFWQEGLATFVELSSRCDDSTGRVWADAPVAFKMRIADAIGDGQWSYVDYQSCIAEQTKRMVHVLKGPVSLAQMEGSYLGAYLVAKGIYEVIRHKIPAMTVDSFLELMRAIIFYDRTIWCGVAKIMGMAGRNEIDGCEITTKLHTCFTEGCRRMALFLTDINEFSADEADALLQSLRERTFMSEEIADDEGYAKVSFPMLRTWSKASEQISAEAVAKLARGVRSFERVAYLRTDSTDFIYHNQRYSPFDFFGHEIEEHLTIIDSRAVLARPDGDSLAFYTDFLEYIDCESAPLYKIRISKMLFHAETGGLSDGNLYLFTLRKGEMEMGVAFIGDHYAYVGALTKQFTPADSLRSYRTLLIDFVRGKSLPGDPNDQTTPGGRFSHFENLRKDHMKRYENSTSIWTDALGQVIDLFPTSDRGPGSLADLMKRRSYSPAMDHWFTGLNRSSRADQLEDFALSEIENLYLPRLAVR
jgi:hypothetical protein